MDPDRGLSQGRSRDARAEARAERVVWRGAVSNTGDWRLPTMRLLEAKDETVDSELTRHARAVALAIADLARLDREDGTVVEQATGTGLTTRAGTIQGRGRDTRAI